MRASTSSRSARAASAKMWDTPHYSIIPGCTITDAEGNEVGSYVSNNAEAVPCPAWVYEVIGKAKAYGNFVANKPPVIDLDQEANIRHAIDYLEDETTKGAVEGTGGDAMTYKVACRLMEIGVSVETGALLLDEHYNPKCSPAWDFDDLVKKMENAPRVRPERAGLVDRRG